MKFVLQWMDQMSVSLKTISKTVLRSILGVVRFWTGNFYLVWWVWWSKTACSFMKYVIFVHDNALLDASRCIKHYQAYGHSSDRRCMLLEYSLQLFQGQTIWNALADDVNDVSADTTEKHTISFDSRHLSIAQNNGRYTNHLSQSKGPEIL